ncbi:MAG: TIGR04002 family protein [Ruminococcus sp.]|nr:TIGR04002 family protein [Ruminococcus sp.]
MKDKKTSTMVLTAMFAAVITISTAYLQIKTPDSGYIHFGDSVIYLAACILPMPYAMCAASIGGGLADILSGSAVWTIPTIIIKSLNVIPFALVSERLRKKGTNTKIITKETVLMSAISGLITIIGYFIAEAIMFGIAASLLSTVLRSLVQPIGSSVIFYGIGLSLDKANFKSLIAKN